MSKFEEESKVITVKMKCDKCGKGFMEREDGIAYPTSPILYPHKCSNCGYKENYFTKYPYQKFVPKEPNVPKEPEEPHEEPSKGKVYISGPISGLEKQDYMKRFADAEKILSERGYIVVNPAKVLARLPEGTAYEEYMKMSLVMLDMCDSIYMLNGWQKSTGAHLELQYAMSMGKKIMYQEDELFRYLAKEVNRNG